MPAHEAPGLVGRRAGISHCGHLEVDRQLLAWLQVNGDGRLEGSFWISRICNRDSPDDEFRRDPPWSIVGHSADPHEIDSVRSKTAEIHDEDSRSDGDCGLGSGGIPWALIAFSRGLEWRRDFYEHTGVDGVLWLEGNGYAGRSGRCESGAFDVFEVVEAEEHSGRCIGPRRDSVTVNGDEEAEHPHSHHAETSGAGVWTERSGPLETIGVELPVVLLAG